VSVVGRQLLIADVCCANLLIAGAHLCSFLKRNLQYRGTSAALIMKDTREQMTDGLTGDFSSQKKLLAFAGIYFKKRFFFAFFHINVFFLLVQGSQTYYAVYTQMFFLHKKCVLMKLFSSLH
jgi:hypothetical protein